MRKYWNELGYDQQQSLSFGICMLMLVIFMLFVFFIAAQYA